MRNVQEIVRAHYEHNIISSGKIYPQFDFGDGLTELLVLLHYRVGLEDIQGALGWSEETTRAKLQLLAEHDFLRGMEGSRPRPTSMVITDEDGRHLYDLGAPAAQHTAGLIRSRTSEIIALYETLQCSRTIAFPEVSLLLLSNVLLDSWQIGTVVRRFAGAETRTPRHGMHYYHSIQENRFSGIREAFGIYGNDFRSFGRYFVGVYGNCRHTVRTLLSVDPAELRRLLQAEQTTPTKELCISLLDSIVARTLDPNHRLDPLTEQSLRALGVMQDGRIVVPVLSPQEESDILPRMAQLVADDLIEILNRCRPALTSYYRESGYSEEVTFDEFLMWWYHFFYTKVTDLLIEDGTISIPRAGLSTYVCVMED